MKSEWLPPACCGRLLAGTPNHVLVTHIFLYSVYHFELVATFVKKIKTNETHQRYEELFMAIFFICETSVYTVLCYYSVWKFKNSDSEKEKIRYFECFKMPLKASVILEERLMETWVKCTLNSPFMHYSKSWIFSLVFLYMYISIPLNPWVPS